MTSGLVSESVATAPILVLGLGNVLLGDDGVGPRLVGELAGHCKNREGLVEFVDGGTQGLALLGYLTRRKAVVILDAYARGDRPGTVSVFSAEDVLHRGAVRATTAHEGNAGELLLAASVLGDLPERLLVVGVEPGSLKTGVDLSVDVHRSLPKALALTENIIEALVSEFAAAVAD